MLVLVGFAHDLLSDVMSVYRRVRTPGATYFFTVGTYKRQQLLCLDGVSEGVLAALHDVVGEFSIALPAWVILPDHLHCLWTLPDDSADYSKAWALIKLRLTKELQQMVTGLAPRSSSRSRRNEGAVWQRRFWEHQIRDRRDFDAHFHYIHFNPVRHGLVRRAVEWPHSTFSRYLQEGVYESDWGGLDEWPDAVGNE